MTLYFPLTIPLTVLTGRNSEHGNSLMFKLLLFSAECVHIQVSDYSHVIHYL